VVEAEGEAENVSATGDNLTSDSEAEDIPRGLSTQTAGLVGDARPRYTDEEDAAAAAALGEVNTRFSNLFVVLWQLSGLVVGVLRAGVDGVDSLGWDGVGVEGVV
jgi:hypothetical protein